MCALPTLQYFSAGETARVNLYGYQQTLVSEIRDRIRAGHRRILLVCPTGSGKGTLATWMVHRATARGKRVLFLVNRRELVKDLSRRLDTLGLDHGVIMGNHPRRKPWLGVHIASIDTLHRRDPLPLADLLFLDEAHFSISPIWQKVTERFACPMVGMTATPIRADGRGLGELYDSMVLGPSIQDLTGRGFLVRTRIFAPLAPDLAGIRIQGGEYNQSQLAQTMDKARLIGDVVDHWMRLGRGRPTVHFAVNVEHSQHVTARFVEAGIRAVHVDANTPDAVRDRTWRGLVDGSIDLCSSVGVISYGWDVPPVSCAILNRPTKSLGLFLQQVGRVLRPSAGKSDALILDHAGSVLEHGFPDEDRDWTLDGLKKNEGEDARDKSLGVRMCRECWCAFPSTRGDCPACGWIYQKQIEKPEVAEGQLEEITDRAAYAIRHLSKNPRLAELQQRAAANGYKPAWVYHQARRLGIWR